jgi:predicted metal-dependent phosphoesterase TrpH
MTRNLLRVEFHCHTAASKDSLLSPRALVEACRRKGIDRVVVTDHNSIRGALAAQSLDPRRVIVGEEIQTLKGELLAAFVREEVPPGLPVREAITRLRAQGAFIYLSHPLDVNRNGGWTEAELAALLPEVDAIEVFNARCLSPEYNRRARAFAQQHGMLGTVGSDAHTAFELGRATLLLSPFEDVAGLKAALAAGRAECRMSSPLIHLTSRLAVWAKRLNPALSVRP